MIGRGGNQKNTKLKKTAAAVFFALGAVGMTGDALAQGQVIASPAQSRMIAQEALARGDLALARDVSNALLARDDTDAIAWMVRGVIAQRTGQPTAARQAAARAYRSSDNKLLRYDAAWLAANAAGAEERWEIAKLWLRRADQTAANDAARNRVASAFRVARDRSPWSTRLSFGVSPSDNVNGGTDPEAEVYIPGIPVPLSGEPAARGLEIEASASTSYRLSESRTQRTEVLGEFYGRKVILADGELDRINEGRTSDLVTSTEYDYAQVAIGLRHQRLAFPNLGPTTITGRIGASYYRNEALAIFANVAVDQDVRLTDSQRLRFGTRLARNERQDSEIQSSTAITVSSDLLGQTSAGDSYRFGLAYTDHDSDSRAVDGYEVRGRASYAFAQPVGGAQWDFGVTVGYRDYPDFAASADGRKNWTYRANLGATFTERPYYGFVPRVEFGYEATDSNIAIYDSEGLSVGFSVVSRF